MNEIVIEKNNYKAFVIVLANLFFMIAAIAATIYGFGEDRMRYWLPGVIAIIGFLIGFLSAVASALQVKSLITITRDGIIDNSSLSAVGYISFDDIKEFIIITIYGKKQIAVIPKDVDIFLSKLSVVKRSMAKRNLNANLPPVTIPVGIAKDMEPEDILSMLKKRLTDYSSLYD
jgi:hypothetical protein